MTIGLSQFGLLHPNRRVDGKPIIASSIERGKKREDKTG